MTHRSSHRRWLALGAVTGALTALYLWRRNARRQTLPPLPQRSDRRRPLALVTGASSGIGETYVRYLARRGYDVVLVARRRARLRALAEELEHAFGVRATVLVADLATDDGVARVVEKIEDVERLDLLVNNAGFGLGGAFVETDVDAVHDMVRVHVVAPIRLTHAALPGMLDRGAGAIVNVSSVAAFYPLPTQTAYGATKAFLNSFTEALHQEVQDSGVRLQVLCPGFTRTEFQSEAGIASGGLSDFAWLSTETVVRHSYRDLRRGALLSVPGLGYQLLVKAAPLIPRPLKHAAIAFFGKLRTRKPVEGKEDGRFDGFPKRTYRSFGELLGDLRHTLRNREMVRRAMTELPDDFRERLMLVVTQVNGCRYCAYYHARLALDEGLSPEEVRALLDGAVDTCPSEETVALFYARHWAESRATPDPEMRQRLVETYGEETAAEIDVALHMIKMGNYVGNAFDYVLYRLSGGRLGKVKL